MTPTAIHEELSTPAVYRGDLCDLLEHLRELVETARSMPLSNSAIVNRDEVLELLDETLERLPEELRQARWLLKEREEYLERARREADEIIAAARVQAEGMVQRTEVVREAHRVARVTIEQAEAHGRQLRNQAEDYVDAKLAGFESTLERTLGVVQKGRRRLQAFTAEAQVEVLPTEPGLFDQDLM
jgi:cell division septum initiation protein DivIVA